LGAEIVFQVGHCLRCSRKRIKAVPREAWAKHELFFTTILVFGWTCSPHLFPTFVPTLCVARRMTQIAKRSGWLLLLLLP
jgi:hypothetical protein